MTMIGDGDDARRGGENRPVPPETCPLRRSARLLFYRKHQVKEPK